MKNMHYTRKGPGRIHRIKPVRIESPEGGFDSLVQEWLARHAVKGGLTQTFLRKYRKHYHHEGRMEK